jgi:hypothetical protein
MVFVGFAVRNLDASRPWYELFFGRVPDVVVNDHEVMWNVAESSWLYVVEGASTTGAGMVSLAVDDLDQTLSELLLRGLEPRKMEVVGDAGRKAHFVDHDGNVATVMQIYA